jgi:hypothetical protein
MDIGLASIKIMNVARYFNMAFCHSLDKRNDSFWLEHGVEELIEIGPMIGLTITRTPAAEESPVEPAPATEEAAEPDPDILREDRGDWLRAMVVER